MVCISRKDRRLMKSDNRVLRRVFERNRDRTNLHKERPRNYYLYPNNTPVKRSKKMRWTGYTTRRRQKRMHTWFCGETCIRTD